MSPISDLEIYNIQKKKGVDLQEAIYAFLVRFLRL